MKLLSLLTLGVALFAAEPFVPASFQVPVTYKGKSYKLVPLGPDLVKVDYDAYMSSIEHLQKNFSNGKWPHSGITMFEAILLNDMRAWVAKAWPFRKVAWPRRDISAEAWAALPAKPR